MELRLYTPDGILFEGDVDSVTLPGRVGSFTVLKDHAPIISSLSAGNIVCHDTDGEHSFSISNGFVQVRDNVITACIESQQ